MTRDKPGVQRAGTGGRSRSLTQLQSMPPQHLEKRMAGNKVDSWKKTKKLNLNYCKTNKLKPFGLLEISLHWKSNILHRGDSGQVVKLAAKFYLFQGIEAENYIESGGIAWECSALSTASAASKSMWCRGKATFHTSLLETRCLMDAILRGHLRRCLMQGGGHPHSAFMKRSNLIDLKSRSCIKK